jgi:c-di-GMP-binding flagellar brake protein YcgR
MGNGFLEVVRARDVSVGGLSVFVPHDFDGCDIDHEVELILTLGNSRPFKTRAVIRHRSRGESKHFFGLQFVALTEEHRAAIERYVSRCTRVVD